MSIRILTRVVVHDKDSQKILLVKNKDTDFWYPPGGGWEYENENILECAKREVYEETGLYVDILRMLYSQEFHATPEMIFFETFWLAKLNHAQQLDEEHVDLDSKGIVEAVKWYSKEELQDLTVFPKRLKNTFWDSIDSFEKGEDPFIGVS